MTNCSTLMFCSLADIMLVIEATIALVCGSSVVKVS